jgi:hypothetical protein
VARKQPRENKQSLYLLPTKMDNLRLLLIRADCGIKKVLLLLPRQLNGVAKSNAHHNYTAVQTPSLLLI